MLPEPVQEVVAHLSAINPSWTTDFNLTKRLEVQKRLNFPFTGLLCDIREWTSGVTMMFRLFGRVLVTSMVFQGPQLMALDLATVGELAAHTVPAFGGAMI